MVSQSEAALQPALYDLVWCRIQDTAINVTDDIDRFTEFVSEFNLWNNIGNSTQNDS